MGMAHDRPAGPVFERADPATHRDELTALNIEYMHWVLDGLQSAFGTAPAGVVGPSVPAYVAGKIDSVCETPPRGVFYLVRLGGALAGMGGLRRLGEGLGELKRIYVRPDCRGARLGHLIVERLLADARAFGYQRLCLDSAPFMASAHRLYEAAGFADCAAYEGTEVPPALRGRWRFMARAL